MGKQSGGSVAPSNKQATFIAVCFIVLVGAITVTALHAYEVDEFLKVWAVIGTLVGVVTGAIPSFFFAVSNGKAQAERGKAEEKVQTVLGVSSSQSISEAADLRPDLFPQSPADRS
jgi:hypothetical protein